jgi:hypothetical protein
MKKALLAVAALSCMGSAALAGPNANGTLIAALSVGTVYTVDNTGYCGSSTTGACGDAVVTHTGDQVAVINIIAAFPAPARLAGLTFGISYSDPGVAILESGHCGDFELPDGTWPASGTGTAVTWGAAQTSNLVEVYWFAAYNYDGGANSLGLIAHPGQGGNFADDDVPSNIDPIAGYGVFGFNMPGVLACPPDGPRMGACCFPDGSCAVLFQADCEAQGGTFQGEGSSCDGVVCDQPDPTGACCVGTVCFVLTADECAAQGGVYKGDDVPCDDTICLPVPTIESSWGTIKNNYR